METCQQKRKTKIQFGIRKNRIESQRELYISILASIDKTVRYTTREKDYSDLIDENTIILAKSKLLATKKINIKLEEIHDIIQVWSSNYRQSLPKRIDGIEMGIITSEDSKYRKKAEELIPHLQKTMGELVEEIKSELNKLSEEIKKNI
ncbi:hypothetical protein UMM65_00805 [Aureibaculum sp. 2210JD6-5]|uniref:hypothetical protein n=1 Tax=Aureibaculum sp. 2210JD6-5 TaxID=3103957 RepID=UPI002AACA3C0|nr:hypothetical protein [Aureibaculum sp. 2210JD6-5]MDY7393769.1 hypothetical protein [Aureibaculum sp. 2210JD6-5]